MKRSFLLFFLTACALGIAIYAGARHNPFHYDDRHSIQYNPHIRSLENLPRFFTDLHTFSSDSRGTMFRPLVLITLALNYALGGQDVEGYRWANLFLHVLCSTLLFALLRRLGAGGPASWAVGLLFLVHPIHSEPVNYISSRSDLLVSCFYAGGLLLALQGRWGGSCAAYVFGLLSKEVAITLPLAAALFQGWSRVRRQWRPYALLGLVGLGYVALIAANQFLASSLAKAPRGLGEQVLTQLKAYVYYLWLFCMPVRLSVEHPFLVSSGLEAAPLLAALFLGSLGFWAARRPGLLLSGGLGFFAVALLPASLVPLNILVSERRMYLASAGLCAAGAWLWQHSGRGRWPASVTLGLLFALMCLSRNQVWASEASLWEEAVARGPQMFRPRANLALAYKHQGREEEALAQLQAALRLKPDYADAWAELGNLRHDRGDWQGAEEAYRKAIEYNPALEGAYYNLGNVAQGRGEWEAAIAYYQEALGRNPRYAEARNNLGQAYEAVGRLEEAVAEYRKALADDPDLPQAWFNLGAALERQGEGSQARDAYQRAQQLLLADPEYPENSQYREFARRARAGFLRLGGE